MTIWDEIKEAGPKENPDIYDISEYTRRWEFIEQYSFAVPSRESIKKIAKFVGTDSILEIGAGSGLWSYLISQEGISVTSVDDYSWNKKQQVPGKDNILIGYYYPIKKSNGTKAVKKFADHNVLLLCWPPYHNNMAANALKAFSGTKVIYIGEGRGGCTGNDEFHRLLEVDLKQVDHCRIPQWPGIHDSVWFYQEIL